MYLEENKERCVGGLGREGEICNLNLVNVIRLKKALIIYDYIGFVIVFSVFLCAFVY